jgi:hypothetical protein
MLLLIIHLMFRTLQVSMLGPLLSLKLARSNDLLFSKGHHTVPTPDTDTGTGTGTAHGAYSMSSTYDSYLP